MLLRSRIPELMDDPQLDQALHIEALDGLDLLNRVSGASSVLWGELMKFESSLENETDCESGGTRKLRVLDVATGGGDNLIRLARLAASANSNFEFVGTDISPSAIDYANEKAKKSCSGADSSDWQSRVKFMQLDALNEKIPSGFDVVMTSLFTHHLDPEDVIALLRNMHASDARMILVNDLVRSRLSYCLVWLASRLLTRSSVVHFDAPVSVRAAFTPGEMRSMALEAGLQGCAVQLHPPCRQLLVWRRR
jgi:2-polyprenyl-3-methyl-5-hydroxy-6-metoxy-1,4-benzoquinol methylase